ncbi:MAG: hypothetical protein MHPSP_003845, partial [Paramarteilia canceri]
KNIPYCFLRTAEEISVALNETPKNMCVFITKKEEKDKKLEKVVIKVNKLLNDHLSASKM